MPAQLIAETDLIDVSSLPVLIYGPPGAWKTSLAQTAADPITLDFDRGAHRAFNRRSVMRFDNWQDVAECAEGSPALAGKKTIVIDTIGRCLDLLTADITSANAKHGSATGGLSLQGYGALKSRFANWINQVRLGGRDVIMLAHEKEEKDGDDRIMRPDITGGSYVEVMKFTDLVGYLGIDRSGKRTLDFNPSDRHLGKNAAGWKTLPVPDLSKNPTFLADLLADAKAKIGHTAQASAALATVVEEWSSWIKGVDGRLDVFNKGLVDLGALANGAKKQAWHLVKAEAHKNGWVFDEASKMFVIKGAA